MTLAPLHFTATQLLDIERGQLGALEHPPGSNETPYGKAYGLDFQPWCAMFQWWAFRQLGIDLRSYLGNRVQVAWTPSFAQAFQRAGAWITDPKLYRPGDVVFYDFGLGRITHVGCVVANPGHRAPGHVLAREGNTSVNGFANGGQVLDCLRPYSVIVGAGRPAYAVPAIPRPAPPPPHPDAHQEHLAHLAELARQAASHKVAAPPFPGRQWFAAGQRNSFVTLLGQQLVRLGCSHYLVGPGPDWSEADRASCAEFQRRVPALAGAADGYPGPLTWSLAFTLAASQLAPK